MALVNPQIAMSYRPTTEYQPRNALAEYAQMQQILNAQDVQQMNALKMQEARSVLQERNALRQLNPTASDYESQLFKVSPQLGIAYRKERTAAEASQAERQSRLAQGAETRQKLLTSALRDISTRPSDANITAHLEDVESSTLFTPEEKQAVRSSVQRLLALPLEERMSAMASLGATPSELKPVVTPRARGNVAEIALTNPFTGQTTIAPGSIAAIPLTEAQRLQNKIAEGQLGVARGQLGVAQQRLAQESQGVTYQQDAQGNIIALPSRLPAGAMPMARPVTGEGNVPIKGKPSAFAEKTAAQQKQLQRDLGTAITELTNAVKEGGLIDQSTGSGAGRMTDIAAGFIGKATPGAIAIGKLQPIADIPLKLIPRFEGPQSDKDTASYKQAAGQLADPSMPTEIRKEAGKTVLRLMKDRKNQFSFVDMTTESATPAVDVDKLLEKYK